MSYAVNWLTKVISIPTSDLVWVSGTRYQLLMSDFLSETRRLEATPADGLWAEQILDHTNAKTLAGATFAPFDEVINGYTIQFTGAATRVDLVGSNNNIVDVLIATGVALVPSNSAGLQVVSVSSGSGLSTEEHDKLMAVPDAPANASATLAAAQVTPIQSTSQDRILEGALTEAEAQRIMLASLAGKVTKTGTNIKFKSVDGLSDRIDGTVDDLGNRTAVTLNGG